MKKTRILDFLNTYGTKVEDDEEASYVELMMDDHICIKHHLQEWYIPKDCSSYTPEDDDTYEYLVENYSLEESS